MSELKSMLNQVLDGKDLSQEQAAAAMGFMTSEDVPDGWKGALLAGLRAKGETAEEVRGFALAMRAAARPVNAGSGQVLVDTCGTGGDGSHSFNVSTAVSFACAAAGLGVVKHGNRSISSKSGSADVLEALGIRLPHSPEAAEALLDHAGWTFLFAPHFHPAMKSVMPVRRGMGVRTIFNMLGPLTNPAQPPFQLIGAWSEPAAELMAHALARFPNLERAFVVHGYPHWDEATPMGPYVRFRVEDGAVEREVVDPLDVGIARCDESDLAGGEASENAAAMRELFGGQLGAVRDAVVLNTALVLELAENLDPREAVERAGDVVSDGSALFTVDAVAAKSQEL
ncbi:MAG: anthranilate phosphoribosyltransferase [Deltaproteobacteria bacterium]|nr:MAG: anthranilate phosphoribosyltransferase [Deltaproteobacteria bacterium]